MGTPLAEDDYWAYLVTPEGTCDSQVPPGSSNSPDGRIVEKGGQAYTLRTPVSVGDRTVLTCTACADNSDLLTFNTANVSGEALEFRLNEG